LRRWDGWMDSLERWFLAPRPIQALIGARITFGATLFIAYALRAPAVLDLWGVRGVGGPDLYARVPDAPVLHPGILPAFDLLRHLPSDALVLALYALLLVASAAFTVGAFTRVAGALALGIHFLLWVRNPVAYVGWATYLNAPLLYVVLAPVGRHVSVDAWLRRRRGLPEVSWYAPGWTLRLLQIHVTTMYALTGWSRLDKPSWLAGETVLIAMTSANFSRIAIDWSSFAPLLALGTWGALVLEALAPPLLWLRATRRFWAWGLIAMHAALVPPIQVEIWAWSAVMTGGLLAFLFDDSEAPTTKG
jgi:hypothetical protein